MKYVARARGGALPVDGRRSDAGTLRRGARRRRPAHGGAPRVRRGRAQLPRPHGVAGGGRDRERAALRGDAAARRRPHQPRRAERAASSRSTAARSSTRVVTAGVRRLLGCDASQLWLRDGEDGQLELVAFDPTGALARAARPSRARRCATIVRRSARWSPCARRAHLAPAQHDELLQAVANQAALALRKAEHIERLTAENLVRDLFEALDDGCARRRPRPAPAPPGCDLDRPHVFIHARPVATGERAASVARGRRARRDAAAHARGRGARRSRPRRAARACSRCRRAREPATSGRWRSSPPSEGVAIGMSAVRSGGEGARESLRQAQDAGVIARRAHPGRRRPGLRGAGRLPLPGPPGARRRAARPALRGGGAAPGLRRAPRDAAARARSSSTSPTAASGPPRRASSSSTPTRCASAWIGFRS